MKLAIGTFLMLSIVAPFSHAQSGGSSRATRGEAAEAASAAVPEASKIDRYAVFNATPAQEMALRAQIRLIHPDVLPLRVFFVPHWKYLAAARDFHLHVPTGYGSLMFTHLPSRTIFIDNDRYAGEDWLGHWMAHELGHLATNSTKEGDAEKAGREFRKRLEDGNKGTPSSNSGGRRGSQKARLLIDDRPCGRNGWLPTLDQLRCSTEQFQIKCKDQQIEWLRIHATMLIYLVPR